MTCTGTHHTQQAATADCKANTVDWRTRALAAEAQVAGMQRPCTPNQPTVTPAKINALPTDVRDYIHGLETMCDPAGLVRENAELRDRDAALIEMLDTVKVLLSRAEARVAELTATGWISVADRVPPLWTREVPTLYDVWVCEGYRIPDASYGDADDFACWAWDDGNNDEGQSGLTVTHWRELPVAPAQEVQS